MRIAAASIALLALAGLVRPQEIDTVLFDTDRTAFRVIDQVRDPAERKALEALFLPQSPAERIRRSEQFLQRYPASSFLSVVYDVGAKSALESGDSKTAIRFGTRSLRLLPENPMLTVSLADALLDLGKPEEGRRLAAAAVQDLERFARPGGFTKDQWDGLEPRFRASAFRSMARAAAIGGMDGNRVSRTSLEQAEKLLLEAWATVPEDPETRHWILQTRKALGKPGYPIRIPAPAPPPLEPPARYAGSAACRSCHPAQYASWQRTGMGRMFRPLVPEEVMGRFPASFPDQEHPVVRTSEKDGAYFFHIADSQGEWRRYKVDFLIGSKWQQAYATRLDDGRIQVLPIQYNRMLGKWVNFWKKIDPPASERTDPRNFTRLTNATNYQANCAPCHTSQLRQTARAGGPETIAFREPGINCEMCHGPSDPHVEARRAGETTRNEPLAPPIRFRAIPAAAYVKVCGQCHRQSAMLTQGGRGEINYSGKQIQFTSASLSRPFLEFSREAFYKDGRFRETTFIVEAFERSACHRRGGAHCGHCHDPHPANPEQNPKSLKYANEPDRMCTQCHASIGERIGEHTHHPAASEGSRCINCHMPRIMNSLMFAARTHTVDDIPDAAMTARFGPEESPNACLLCHSGQTAEWVVRQTQDWYRPAARSKGSGE